MTISYNQFSYVTRLVLGIMKSKSQKAEQVSWNFKSKSLIIRFTFVSKENCNISTAILLVFDIYFGPIALCIDKGGMSFSDSYSFNPIGWQENYNLFFIIIFLHQSELINCVKKSITQSFSLTFKVASLMSALVRSHLKWTMDIRPSRSLKEDKLGS